MVSTREYIYCCHVSGGLDHVQAAKKAFGLRRDAAYETAATLDARADIAAMVEFLQGGCGQHTDDELRLENLMEAAYRLATSEELKATERVAMMKEYRSICGEIEKRNAKSSSKQQSSNAIAADLAKLRKASSEVDDDTDEATCQTSES